jgi:geranyl diphosphate synthase
LLFQVPKLASAAEYFFKMGAEGKRFRPTVTHRSLHLFKSILHYYSISWLSPYSILCIQCSGLLYWQVLLLMASALKFSVSESTEGGVFSMLASTLRTRQQNIAEITEMIHVSMAADLLIRPIMVVF